MQLWTVELKDDHENVSFTSMMENPEYQNMNASLLMDDVTFYGNSVSNNHAVGESTRVRNKSDGSGMGYQTLSERSEA